MRGFVLSMHIAAGTVGLLIGPVAMRARKRRGLHTNVGAVYQAATAVLAATSVGLAAYDWGALWWLALIGIATEAAALGGLWVRRRRRPGWLPVHVQLMCGSYVSFVTAFLVVNTDSPWAWVLPTVVATPLIAVATERTRRGTPAVA